MAEDWSGFLPGFSPNTDTVEVPTEALVGSFAKDVARVRRTVSGGELKLVIAKEVLFLPLPEEFLWRPIVSADGVIVWLSLIRGWKREEKLFLLVHQIAGGAAQSYRISREMVQDEKAFSLAKAHLLEKFLDELHKPANQPTQGEAMPTDANTGQFEYGEQPRKFSEILADQKTRPQTWSCLQCIGERKVQEMQGTEHGDLPRVSPAVTMLNGTAICYEHVQVQRQSSLQLPN